jgi:pimeloyl-ACP methyl ester carboxylesterase
MTSIIGTISKKAWILSIPFVALFTSCAHCPKEETDALLASVPDLDHKDHKVDLKGWTYEKVVTKFGETLHYYHMASKKPNAEPFVLVHGMFLDGRTWLNFAPLSDEFELFALDLPHDSMFYTGYTTDFPKLLQQFLDALQLKRIYLAGVSLGGQISMYYMINHPKTKVDGLVLISTDAAKSEEDVKKANRMAETALKLTSGEDDKMICLVNKLANRKKNSTDPADQEVMKIFSLKSPSFYREAIYISYNLKEPTPIHNITVPTLVIHGDADSTIPFDSAKHLVEYIPNSELKVVRNGEHNMVYTRADEVIAYIRGWLKK